MEVRSTNLNDLDEATVKFFPKSGEWSGFCFQQDSTVEKINLPCHLHDSNWLAECLELDQDMIHENHRDILDYVKTSEFFNEKRKEYEMKIVKWQIELILSGGTRIAPYASYEGAASLEGPMGDVVFRKSIVETLAAIGMDHEVIEEGIEIYADLWREVVMENAFYSQYSFLSYLSGQEEKIGPYCDDAHLQAWLRLRRYDYYQEHKESVDRYGCVLPDMQLSDEEAQGLREYVTLLNQKRIAELEAYLNQADSLKLVLEAKE